jgi:predicted transcriptional regulator
MARDEERSRTTLAGRRQFLVYVDPALVKEVKRLALERDESASAVVEEAIREYLDRKGVGKSRSRSTK